MAPSRDVAPSSEGHDFGEYIVYVDESGDHSLKVIDPNYPIFVLAFCIFQKDEYMHKASPMLQALKFETFGHDTIVFHERDIIKKSKDFLFLRNESVNSRFIERLTRFIDEVPFHLIAVAIDKNRHKRKYANPEHPYHLAMEFGLERVCAFLREREQAKVVTPVVFECRGKEEDEQLELEFRRVTGGQNRHCSDVPLEFLRSPKSSNSCGLQIADLVARPIGRFVLNRQQPNRAFEVLKKKFRMNDAGQYFGYGLKIFP